MNIKTKGWLGLSFTTHNWQQVKDKYVSELTGGQRAQLVLEGEDPEEFRKSIIERHAEGIDNIDYLFTEPALEIVTRIQVKKMNLSLLANISRDMATLIVDKETFYRYHTHQGSIYVIFVGDQKQNNNKDIYRSLYWFRIDTVEGKLYSDGNYPQIEERFLQAMIYLEFSDQITEILEPTKSNGKSRKEGKVINSTPHPFTVVNSKWNTTTIRNTGFKVSGHWRLQPHGQGMKQVKLIFIEEYKKDGLTRKMIKEDKG